MHFGSVIKKIRKNKGFTQKEIAKNHFAQSTYSSFEANHSHIHEESFFHILNALQLTSEEFLFIANDYKEEPSVEIIRRFFQIPYNNKQDILKIMQDIENCGSTHMHLQEIQLICEALLIIAESGDLLLARKKVTFIWNRLSKYDQLYLHDIKIMNAILYFLDSETAIEVTNRLLQRLHVYKHLPEANLLTINLTINLAAILVKSSQHHGAEKILEQLLNNNLPKIPYKSLAICYYRLAICYSFTNKEKVALCFNKIESLLYAYDNKALLNQIRSEYEKNSNKAH